METSDELETRNEKPGTSAFWRYVPLLIWIGVIFFLSSSEGSMTRTSRFIRPLLEFLFPAAPEETLLFYHGIIRKFAHFAEYAVLGFLAYRAFSTINVIRKYLALFAIAFVVVIASADELGQSFNPNRTGSPVDVMIDVGGGVFGVLVAYALRRRSALGHNLPS